MGRVGLIFFIVMCGCSNRGGVDAGPQPDSGRPSEVTVDSGAPDAGVANRPEALRWTVLTLPLMDSKNRLLIPDGKGSFALMTPPTAPGLRELDLAQMTAPMREGFGRLERAAVIVGGNFEETADGFRLEVTAVDGLSGLEVSHADAVLDKNKVRKVEAPEGVTLHALSSPYAAPNARALSLSSLLTLNATFALPLFEVKGPRGGWGQVFKDALGVGETRERPRNPRPPSFPRPRDDQDNLDDAGTPDGGTDPRDEPPPTIFGEELDGGVICRVKLQCQYATQMHRSWMQSPAGVLFGFSFNGHVLGYFHCGWYTFIPDAAQYQRLGFDVQAVDFGTRGLSGRTYARVFNSDQGFKELSVTFQFEPYDSQPVDNGRSCEIANCVRRSSWTYAALGDRPYDMFPGDEPNSNSFIGAIAKRCAITDPDFPPAADDGKYPGWNYWRDTGPQSVRPDWAGNLTR